MRDLRAYFDWRCRPFVIEFLEVWVVWSQEFEGLGDCSHGGRRRPNQCLESLESSRVETAVAFLRHTHVSTVALVAK